MYENAVRRRDLGLPDECLDVLEIDMHEFVSIGAPDGFGVVVESNGPIPEFASDAKRLDLLESAAEKKKFAGNQGCSVLGDMAGLTHSAIGISSDLASDT